MMAVRCVVRLDMYMWSSVIQRGNGCRGHGVPFSIPVAPGVIDHDVRVHSNSASSCTVRHTRWSRHSLLAGRIVGSLLRRRWSRKLKRQRRRRCSLRPWSWCQGSDFMPFQTLHHTRLAPEHRKADFGPSPQKPEGPALTFRFFTGVCVCVKGHRCVV